MTHNFVYSRTRLGAVCGYYHLWYPLTFGDLWHLDNNSNFKSFKPFWHIRFCNSHPSCDNVHCVPWLLPLVNDVFMANFALFPLFKRGLIIYLFFGGGHNITIFVK